MISRDSILRRLPSSLDQKQALFMDGIRHSGEIAGFAYNRLQSTLTRIATQELTPEKADELYTSAFLDAWSLVDIIDRFRALWLLFPDSEMQPPPAGEKSFKEISRPVRSLRNVTDHLAQRVEYVLSHGGSALGSLSWFTITDLPAQKGVICAIVPGTLRTRSHSAANPCGRRIEVPTGHIELSAGEYTANISEVLPHMEIRIRELESSLAGVIAEHSLEESQAGADLLLKIEISGLCT